MRSEAAAAARDAPDVLDGAEREHLARFMRLSAAARKGVRALDAAELEDLPRLYRFAATSLARLRRTGDDPALATRLEQRLVESHRWVLGGLPSRESKLRRIARVLLSDAPRAVRAERTTVLGTGAVLYSIALLSFALVRRDLTEAYALLDPRIVDGAVRQLEALPEGQAWRGNFDFGIGESAGTAGLVMGNNLRVAATFFAVALVPPLFALVLATNGAMLGAYTGIAAHFGQAGSISSVLWCHGVLEIQAIVLAGAAGLVVLRGWWFHGAFTRRASLARARSRALPMLAASLAMLVCAGFIEGYVTPHVSTPVRVAVAAASAAGLALWIARRPAGSSRREEAAPAQTGRISRRNR